MPKPTDKLKDPDYLFNIFKLNKWFAISSILLMISMLAMVQYDYVREWKGWQRKFRTLEIEKTKKALANANAALASNEEFKETQKKLEKARSKVRKNEVKIHGLGKELRKIENRKYKETRVHQDQKALRSALRYTLEEATKHNEPNAPKLKMEFNELVAAISVSRKSVEDVEEEYEQKENEIKELKKDRVDIEKGVKEYLIDVDRLKLKERKIERSFVNDILRDAPLMDFIYPSLKVKEIILPDLKIDYSFAKVPRVDSCTTCHIAIDKKGYENQPNPLKTHPNLDLFLSTKSPHKINEFGCTVCHMGQGGSLTFAHSAHTPKDLIQASEWKKKYNWHRTEHWIQPMLKTNQTEASCYGCHQKDVRVPQATKLNKALELVERLGCYGCHKIEGWEIGMLSGLPTIERK